MRLAKNILQAAFLSTVGADRRVCPNDVRVGISGGVPK